MLLSSRSNRSFRPPEVHVLLVLVEPLAEMGKMLVEKCESISKEAAEQHAQFAEEVP